MSTIRQWSRGLAATLVLACGPVRPDAVGASSSTDEPGTSTTSTASTLAPTSTDTSDASSSTGATSDASTCGDACPTSDSGGFVVTPDMYERGVDCDTFTQNCSEGQKCSPYAEGGGSAWNATKCVPVTGDREPGESCTAEGGGVSGFDDCVKGAFCWDVDAQNHGTCIEQCGGTRQTGTCNQPGHGCYYFGETLNFCVATCAPLVQDCADDGLCFPMGGTYICVIDDSGDGGATFDPCELANACDKGLVCLAATSASECDQGATGCCLPMCSIAEGSAACPGADQQCFPVYEPQPTGFEDVGYCSLMP